MKHSRTLLYSAIASACAVGAVGTVQAVQLSGDERGQVLPADDGAGAGLDRTKEGHFEIIEMETYASTSTTDKAVTHVNGLAPCGVNLNDTQAAADALPPSGGLFGGASIVNVNSGTDYTFDAVALSHFYDAGPNYQASGTSLPDLTQASPPVSSVFTEAGFLYESTWASGTADAVSAVLMRDSVMNEYVLDNGTKSGTDWVVTFPTKRFYVSNGSGNATKLFQRNINGAAGSCDDLSAGRSVAEANRPRPATPLRTSACRSSDWPRSRSRMARWSSDRARSYRIKAATSCTRRVRRSND